MRAKKPECFHTDAARIRADNRATRPPYATQLFVLGLSLFVATTVGCARFQPTAADIPPGASARQRAIEGMIDSTVKITVERDGRRVTSASGVVIASRGAAGSEAVSYVLTAAHALVGGDGVAVTVGFCGADAARGKFPATAVVRGAPETLDLALLRVRGIAAPAVRLPADDGVWLGQPILVIGFPEGERLGLSGGIVSQLPLSARPNGIPADRPEHRIVIDAAAPRGVSGGGVFEAETGRLIGIVQGHQTVSMAIRDQSQSYTLKFPVPGATFVVPMAQIRPFLARPEASAELRTLLPETAQTASSLPR
jgi:S1-C subfamily serine protease